MSESRLSTLDASFLEVESACAHMHVGWAALFAPPRGRPRPTFEELRDHVAGRMSRAPRYRQKLAPVPLGVNVPVWVDDEDFDIRRHVRRATATDLGEATDEVMSAQLDRDRPLWELWIADRLADGRIGAIGKAHHAMVDGLAAVELATLLLDPTPEPAPPEDDGWRPQPRPGALSLLADGVLDRGAQALELATWPLQLARRPGRLASLPGDSDGGADEYDIGNSGTQRWQDYGERMGSIYHLFANFQQYDALFGNPRDLFPSRAETLENDPHVYVP